MKIGLDNGLNAYQVAALRISSSGLVMLPVAYRAFKKIPADKYLLIFLSGAIGSLIPAFLFCIAEEKIDSSLAGTLNAVTPIFAIIMGALFFQTKVAANKITGILIAFAGMVLLFFSKGSLDGELHLGHTLLVVLAAIMYGFNVNLVSKKLSGISSLHLTAVALCTNAVPAAIVLYFTGFFSLPFHQNNILIATGAAAILGIIGTAVATIIFYALVKRASPVFASMVTYGIPFIAIAWGIYYKEEVGWKQLISLLVILAGVYWANRKKQV